MTWIKPLLIVGVICLVLFIGTKAFAKPRELNSIDIEPPPPPPLPPGFAPFAYDPTIPKVGYPGADPAVLVWPNGDVDNAPMLVNRYGVEKTKGMIGYLAKRRSQPLSLPIKVTQNEVNQISTAWGGSVGYFETIKFANDVGALLLSFTPARPIAAGYKAIDKGLSKSSSDGPPPPPPPPPR